ncbi:hypothetical protein AB0K70_29570, partial [Streptomyces werraensis]
MAEAALKTVPLDKARALQWLQRYGVYAGVALLLVVNIVITPHFLSAENFRTQAVQVAPVIIVALGMALVIGPRPSTTRRSASPAACPGSGCASRTRPSSATP